MRFSAWLLCFLLVGCHSLSRTGNGDSALYSESHLDFAKWKRTPDCCAAQGGHAAVSSAGENSSRAGVEILKAGGNAVDAAVATAFMLAVERPQSVGLGGGGFMTLHLKDQGDFFVDFRETAPRRATRDMFIDTHGRPLTSASQVGARAVAVPGFVAGLYEIHQKWGKLPWKKCLEPAIRLAREGFKVYPSLADKIVAERDKLTKYDYTRSILFRDNRPLQIGDVLVQRDLARTIQRVARDGKDGFYSGPVAKKINDFFQARGGLLDMEDLAHYEVKFRDPLFATWKGYHIVTAPPPSSGGVLFVEMTNILNGFDLDALSRQPVAYTHLLTEVMKYGYADRSKFIGDPAFVKDDYKKLLSQAYADAIRAHIDLDRDTPSSQISPGRYLPSDHGTSHLDVIDEDGDAVSSTLTINWYFGARFAVPGVGAFMNDEMDDFSIKPGVQNVYGLTGGEENAIAPGKRPVSSMMPTIVLDGSRPRLVLGGAGGSRIMSAVIQVMLNDLVVYPWDLHRAVFAPRIHHQWLPDKLEVEHLPDDVKSKLEAMGHQVTPYGLTPVVEAAQKDPDGDYTAVFDPRSEGGADAY